MVLNFIKENLIANNFSKELLNLASEDRPFLIFFDSIDELTGSQDKNNMAWLPLKLPPHCKFVVSVTCEDKKKDTLDNLKCLRAMIEDENQFLKVTELGRQLAWHVTKVQEKYKKHKCFKCILALDENCQQRSN